MAKSVRVSDFSGSFGVFVFLVIIMRLVTFCSSSSSSSCSSSSSSSSSVLRVPSERLRCYVVSCCIRTATTPQRPQTTLQLPTTHIGRKNKNKSVDAHKVLFFLHLFIWYFCLKKLHLAPADGCQTFVVRQVSLLLVRVKRNLPQRTTGRDIAASTHDDPRFPNQNIWNYILCPMDLIELIEKRQKVESHDWNH